MKTHTGIDDSDVLDRTIFSNKIRGIWRERYATFVGPQILVPLMTPHPWENDIVLRLERGKSFPFSGDTFRFTSDNSTMMHSGGSPASECRAVGWMDLPNISLVEVSLAPDGRTLFFFLSSSNFFF